MIKFHIGTVHDRLGTGLAGYLTASVNDLFNTFGSAQGHSGDGKTTHEWVLVFDDGTTIATIYDYKQPPTSPETAHRWHIGGRGQPCERLREVLNPVIASTVERA